MGVYFSFLKDVYFFKSLADKDIHLVENVCKEEHYCKGTILFKEGSNGDKLYLVLSGKIEIWKNYQDFTQELMAVKESGQLVGEMALIENLPRSASAVIKTSVRLLCIKQTDFNGIIQKNNAIPISIMKSISAMVRRSNDDFLNNLRDKNNQLADALQRLSKSEAKYRLIFENATNGIFQARADGRLITANPVVTKLLDLPESKNINIFKDYLFPDPLEFKQYIQTLSRHDVENLEISIVMENCPVIYLSVNIRTVRDHAGQVLHYNGFIDNITQRKKVEAHEVARKTAEASSKAKSEFLANMSHEIRTPMNAIIGMTGLAMEMKLSSKVRDYIATVQVAAHSLLGIINDILDFSKIEAGHLDMDCIEFKLDGIDENLVDLFGKKVEEQGIKLILTIARNVPRALIGDPVRLGQVLTNLVSNAIKFTHQGEVIVRVQCLHQTKEKASLLFQIEDSGIGIHSDHLDKLFNAFTQVYSSTTRVYGGTGLGLAISRQLVEMMQGKIRVESAPGAGSIFEFTANFKRPASSDTAPEVLPEGLKILLTDSSQICCVIMQEMLVDFGFKVETAGTGEKGLDKLVSAFKHDDPFQLVIINTEIKDMNGSTMVAKLKSNPDLITIPVIMTTSMSRARELEGAEALGINAFITKPIKPSHLLNLIFAITSGRSTELWAPKHTQRDRLKGTVVLLVEDNKINQKVAVEILTTFGMQVRVADNGAQALQAVSKTAFDGVLMDIQMPGMDGYEVTRHIRAAGFEELPIIAMTAMAMKGDAAKCLKAGMDAYIAKPIEPADLYQTLLKWIKPLPATNLPKQLTEPQLGFELPELPGIVVEDFLARLDDNQSLLVEILQDFKMAHANNGAEIRQALQNNDKKFIRQTAHMLKGVAGNISAMDLQKAALRLETAVRNDRMGQAHGLAVQVEKEIERILQSANLVKSLQKVPVAAPDPSTFKELKLDAVRIRALFSRLFASLNQNDPVKTEINLAVIKKHFVGTRYYQQIMDMEACTDIFQFEKTRELLTQLNREMEL